MSDLWRIVLTDVFGFGTGVLSGMFGIGGAVASTPAIRVLGATPLAAVGSTIPSIIPSAVTGAWRYGAGAARRLADRRVDERRGRPRDRRRRAAHRRSCPATGTRS